MLAAIHPYGHEEPLEISQDRVCFSSSETVSTFEEDTLEELSHLKKW